MIQRRTIDGGQLGQHSHRTARMFIQHGQHAPSLAVESETAQLAVEHAIAPPENLSEPEKYMFVDLERRWANLCGKPAFHVVPSLSLKLAERVSAKRAGESASCVQDKSAERYYA